jgi:alpha-L-fucosidase
VEIRLGAPAAFDVIRLREQIRLGQRVEAFEIDAWLDSAWKPVHSGQSIGNQVLARLENPVTTDRVRLRITRCPAPPCISEVSLFKMPAMASVSGESRIAKSNVKKSAWKIVSQTAGDASHAIDGNTETFWHTHMATEQAPPQDFVVDMGAETPVGAFTYLPRQDGVVHGMTDKFRFELSTDGTSWKNVAEGEFSNIAANPVEQTVPLKNPEKARYFRFTGLHAVEKNHVSAAEVGVITAP